jgi:tRNA U34 5-methylaminomethyl-2-thiouridine-forming methyltransferase MnmC
MTTHTKLPPGHNLVETGDGTFTLFSEAFQEACHSTTGAKAETILHYVEGCRIPEKANLHQPLIILEVGFGLGIGFETTLEKIPKDKKFHFISMEIDRNLLDWYREKRSDLELMWHGNILEAKKDNFTLTIIQGDARKALPEYLKSHPLKWHAIYQDAFSPKRNPVLWTKEWFTLLKGYSHPDVILSTYSASTSIRKSLHETGWGVQSGEKFGPKRTSTRAMLNKPTDTEILLHMERSPVAAMTDFNIK